MLNTTAFLLYNITWGSLRYLNGGAVHKKEAKGHIAHMRHNSQLQRTMIQTAIINHMQKYLYQTADLNFTHIILTLITPLKKIKILDDFSQ